MIKNDGEILSPIVRNNDKRHLVAILRSV